MYQHLDIIGWIKIIEFQLNKIKINMMSIKNMLEKWEMHHGNYHNG